MMSTLKPWDNTTGDHAGLQIALKMKQISDLQRYYKTGDGAYDSVQGEKNQHILPIGPDSTRLLK